ncbi:hypothetical protein EAL2_c07050 [Peptoclostridium acidaminophilum DSM 3953]|uniref:Aspartyl/glutamyl-tRNA(Asn/Gln) amidotransferase subunit C n=2 Tax=Peptoclostridium acidaminophilum TaxID=1731 RepID=W8U4X8_PEPAC|nr:hypothetical protein EAL2_c07050 [Peptoclostridium acidaminophilum DSM 3953]
MLGYLTKGRSEIMIDKDVIAHIAHLSRLEIKDEEVQGYMEKINSILSYVENLQSVNTENVDITYNTNNSFNAFRDDAITLSMPREDVLMNAPDSEMGCFKVPKVLE